jgi:hypothetical protein
MSKYLCNLRSTCISTAMDSWMDRTESWSPVWFLRCKPHEFVDGPDGSRQNASRLPRSEASVAFRVIATTYMDCPHQLTMTKMAATRLSDGRVQLWVLSPTLLSSWQTSLNPALPWTPLSAFSPSPPPNGQGTSISAGHSPDGRVQLWMYGDEAPCGRHGRKPVTRIPGGSPGNHSLPQAILLQRSDS